MSHVDSVCVLLRLTQYVPGFTVVQSLRQLMQLEAIPPGAMFTITPTGRQMLHFPINPLLAKVLISSFEFGCTREIIDIIALREAGNPILESHTSREVADRTRKAFVHRDGDHLTGMNVFRGFLEALAEARKQTAAAIESPAQITSGGMTEKTTRKAVLDWCNDRSLSFRVLHEAMQLRTQLIQLVKTTGNDPDVSAGEDSNRVLHCLTRGLYMNAARLQPDGRSYQPVLNRIGHEVSRFTFEWPYQETRVELSVNDQGGLKIHPSSVLAGKRIPTIIYDEIVSPYLMFEPCFSSLQDFLIRL